MIMSQQPEPITFNGSAAEQALRDSEAKYRAIFQGAVDGIVTIDERGMIESINPAGERLFGYAAQEVIGRNIKMLMPEPYHSHHDQYLANYMHTGQAKIIGIGREVQGRRKDGSTFPMDLAVSEVKLGTRRMFTGIVRDITLRKQAEREVMQAKDDAVAANAAKDHFIAVVSHELRTPLNPVMVAVAYLESRLELPQDVREELVAIRRNIEHEARLVDDLLNLTRLSRGKIELHQEAVDAHALVRAVLTQFQAKIDQKKIRVITSLRARQHYIWADPTRIRQVMTNLVDNAIKFSPNQSEITLRTSYTADGDFRLEIADNGIGIEPEVLARLFSPFEQGERTITRKFGGLGLGLAICKGIVDLHGGKLTAYSQGKDKGATFILELAVVPAAAGETNDEGVHEEREIQACRVLLVEDHPDTLRIMAKLLKAMGYRVISATNVSEALRLAHDQPFDILLSDIGLPDGTGVDLLRQIKTERTVKAIAVSGFTQEEDRLRGQQAGFMEYLTKPVDFQMLESVLRRVSAQEPISPPAIWKN